MFKTVEGVYRDGRIELIEPAPAGRQAKVRCGREDNHEHR